MVKNLNLKLNNFLDNQIISKEYFEELKYVANITDFDVSILKWFRYLQTIEITGWRNKQVTNKICRILMKKQPLQFYSLFCPSYLKGTNAFGFRIDGVGNTTISGIKRLSEITNKARELGFNCNNSQAIFFDLALEQPDKTIQLIEDLKININNFKKNIPNDMSFLLLSDKFPELMDLIGYQGVMMDPLPVENKILNRVIERGGKFYELFGWDDSKVVERSKVIATSEAIVGIFLRHNMGDAIMVYTPTMLERAQVYSGKHQNDPLAIIFPKK